MYVIFPADEVVYLSYGRLIIVPNAQETGRVTETSSTAPSVQRISDNRCSNPSVPSTSTSSTRSFHSVISGPSLSSYSEDLQESSRLRRGGVETLEGSLKSNRSWPQPSTSTLHQPPLKPSRSKKKRISITTENCQGSKEKPPDNIEKPFQRDTVQELQGKNSRSSNTVPIAQDCLQLERRNSKSPNLAPNVTRRDSEDLLQGRNSKFPNLAPSVTRRDNQDPLGRNSKSPYLALNVTPRDTQDFPLQRNNSKTSNLVSKRDSEDLQRGISSNPGRKLSYNDYVTVYTGEENEATIESLENSKPEGNPSSLISPRVKLARSLDREKLDSGEVPLNPKIANPKPNPKGSATHKRTKSSDSSKTKVSRERSPKASSSIDREYTPVNSARAKNECEYLSVGEETLSKSSVRGSSPNTKPRELSLNPDSRLQLTGLRQLTPEKTPPAKKSFFGSVRGKRTIETNPKMAGTESPLRDLTHPSYNEALKAHNAVTFKLVRTVSDFTQQLGQIYEHHAEELQLFVSNFKKKNGELRKERPACPSSLFHTWETLLQEVEIDSQALGDIASILGRQVSRPLLERSFCRKIQSRKVFAHRESYETIVTKTEEKLAKCRQEYKTAYLSYLSTPTTESLSAYFNNHNAYVQQLHATNGMLEAYGKDTLPQLLQEIDEIYTDLCSSVSDAILQGAEVVSARANERHKRYDSLISQCRVVSGASDLAHLARSLPAPQGRGLVLRRAFAAPQPPVPEAVDGLELAEIQNDNIPPPLKDELVIDRLSAVQVQPAHDALKKESADLEGQIRQIHDALETLLRIQQRSLESALYNKANELQEDISMKRFDLRVAQMHLSAIHSQKELFLNKLESADSGRERKMSSASTGSMKNKWLKAFKSLKTPPPSASPKETEKKNGSTAMRDIPRSDPDAHIFQEYTYKKITPCDVCSQILRGHTRQGLKCRFCKMNVHVDCQDKAPKCQPKSRLLRRQKSTSEIESRVPESTVEEESREDETFAGMATINRQLSFKDNSHLKPPQDNLIEGTEVDQIYQVLKQAGEISNNKPRVNLEPVPPIGITVDRGAPGSAPGSSGSSGQSLNRKLGAPPQPQRAQGSSLTVNNPAPCSTSSDRRRGQIDRVQGSSTAETSSMRRRLFAGMKSLTGFGSRSRQGSPSHRSISLPETPHSPRRQKLNLRMKSLSLDSPESTEHVQRRRHHAVTATSEPHSKESSSSRIQFPARSTPLYNRIARSSIKARSTPSSPVHNRRLLSAKNIRMSSVELPDENDKSPSSASTSPCPSPVGAKKSHRLLPTNLYVVLYNFKSRHQDELDLKAGDKVTVIDFSDPDWWKGKCLGRVGYFPSKYCSKLAAGEKPLQVTHNLQLSDGDNGLMLLRDQIVIQIGEEIDGMVMIRSGDNRQGVCPVKFLQEV